MHGVGAGVGGGVGGDVGRGVSTIGFDLPGGWPLDITANTKPRAGVDLTGTKLLGHKNILVVEIETYP